MQVAKGGPLVAAQQSAYSALAQGCVPASWLPMRWEVSKIADVPAAVARRVKAVASLTSHSQAALWLGGLADPRAAIAAVLEDFCKASRTHGVDEVVPVVSLTAINAEDVDRGRFF